MSDQTSEYIQHCLVRLKAGDASARHDLLVHSQGRLRELTSRMLASFPNVRRWEDSDDVLQNVLVKVDLLLGRLEVKTVREYLRLAALNIRHVLLDLARHYYGPLGLGANHQSPPPGSHESARALAVEPVADASCDPEKLALWGEFHESVAKLPDEQCEVFDLIWYHGLTQEETADVLGISLSSVKRRWQSARVNLMESLGNESPF